MTILGKYIETEEDEELNYKIPAVFKMDKSGMSLKKSIVISTAIHPLTVFLVWLAIFVAGLLGISFVLFNKPEAKTQDIEFVLVDKEDKPINPKTRFRSDKNSRAGGKHDPKRKVSMPKAGGSGAPSKAKPQAQPSAKQPQKKVQQQAQKSTTPKKSTETSKSKTQGQSPAKVEAPTPAPRPSVTPTAPKVTDKPKSNIVIPTPKTNIPKLGAPAGTGPIASPSGTGTGTGNKTGSGSGLSFAPTGSGSSVGSSGRAGGSGGSSGTGRGTGTGSGVGAGNVGNPGPGNPNGRPGIDAIKEPDFGPYMRDLQQRIKRNWEPPKGEESRRVVILFTIARDGRLMSKRITKSSGLAAADKAAMSAVELSAPFKPLPADYKES